MLGFLWLTFRYQDSVSVADFPPTPQRARPKSKWSEIETGRRVEVNFDAWINAPSAVAPLIVAALPLPPVPAPKQSAFGLVLIDAVPVRNDSSARTLPVLPTTRRWTGDSLGERRNGDDEGKREGQRARGGRPGWDESWH